MWPNIQVKQFLKYRAHWPSYRSAAPQRSAGGSYSVANVSMRQSSTIRAVIVIVPSAPVPSEVAGSMLLSN
jgi:hypothetical protein